MNPLVYLITIPIRAYRLFVSPWLGKNCRFQPTCSEYAIEALRVHGIFKGSWLTLKRVSRCNPLAECGFDPVPEKNTHAR